MKTISLVGGHEVLVDDEDFVLLSQRRWFISKNRRGHAYATTTIDGKWVGMHRFIMRPEKGLIVDHINGNGLDNRRCNLRVCTHGQNKQNSKSNRDLPKGVHKRVQRTGGIVYRAQLRHDGRLLNLGTFQTPDEASAAYFAKAKQIFGQFARA